jgi:hypothetical protein
LAPRSGAKDHHYVGDRFGVQFEDDGHETKADGFKAGRIYIAFNLQFDIFSSVGSVLFCLRGDPFRVDALSFPLVSLLVDIDWNHVRTDEELPGLVGQILN